jgi:hypothetical protein
MHATQSNISLTTCARTASRLATREAEALGHEYLGTEAFLLGIAAAGGPVAELLASHGVDPTRLRPVIRKLYTGREKKSEHFLPPGRSLLQSAINEARQRGQTRIDSEHLLLALLKEEKCRALAVLSTLGVDLGELWTDVLQRVHGPPTMAETASVPMTFDDHPKVQEHRTRIDELQKRIEEAAADMDFQAAADLRAEQKALQAELAGLVARLAGN